MMTWKQFARTLFDLEDSDPTYYAMARTKMLTEKRMRFMVGWCTFYNPGIAAQASEYTGRAFWDYLRGVYPTAKRASERRHFRGATGLNAINSWEKKFKNPEALVEFMQGVDYFEVAENAKSVAQMGPYFIWKFADVQERVFCIPCKFPPGAAAKSPKVPQEGAKLINPYKTVLETYTEITDYMADKEYLAPPWYDRPLNMQEAESVCCIFKQHSKGKWAPHTRTAKATRSLLSTISGTGSNMLNALHSETKIPLNKRAEWASEKLAQIGL